MASEIWRWVGIGVLDGLIVAALGYALYEARVRRGAHHEDAPAAEPATALRRAATPAVPRQGGAHHPPTTRTCAWLESRRPGWLVEYDPWRGEYRAQRDITAPSPATAAAEDPWELERAIDQYAQLATSLRALAEADGEAA
ncbi:hypothetical protein F4561_006590 [Lipingzhangella halophila]|uniref:Uncharacterized protein n=1 Tax=Lipingzhangella halophila TaxID=1783352 RepID=A0A7W7RQF6_9ACTN|nr:hypothetical protein [Lipingzhangella halophila]MBB4935681.1 hypothetical protein [Lipingzhangella halophila]